jgi:hypothetical protein
MGGGVVKLPDWLPIAEAEPSPLRTALLCAASYFRNRNRPGLRKSRSRRAVAGYVETSVATNRRESLAMARKFIRDARAILGRVAR